MKAWNKFKDWLKSSHSSKQVVRYDMPTAKMYDTKCITINSTVYDTVRLYEGDVIYGQAYCNFGKYKLIYTVGKNPWYFVEVNGRQRFRLDEFVWIEIEK